MQRITHLITRAYKPLLTAVIVSAALLLSVTPVTVNAQTPPVKMSKSKICHDTSSPYYKHTIQLPHALMPEAGFLKDRKHQAQEALLN